MYAHRIHTPHTFTPSISLIQTAVILMKKYYCRSAIVYDYRITRTSEKEVYKEGVASVKGSWLRNLLDE